MPVWVVTHLGPRNYILDGVELPRGKGQFWGFYGPLKSTVSHCCGVCSKKINNSISATVADCTFENEKLVYFWIKIRTTKHSLKILTICRKTVEGGKQCAHVWRPKPKQAPYINKAPNSRNRFQSCNWKRTQNVCTGDGSKESRNLFPVGALRTVWSDTRPSEAVSSWAECKDAVLTDTERLGCNAFTPATTSQVQLPDWSSAKSFPYSLPSVGPGADPGVQAVRLQVIYRAVGCHYFPPGLRLPSQTRSITAPWPVPSYTAWWQRHIGVNNLPKIVTQLLTRVAFEPTTCWSQVQRSACCATAPPQVLASETWYWCWKVGITAATALPWGVWWWMKKSMVGLVPAVPFSGWTIQPVNKPRSTNPRGFLPEREEEEDLSGTQDRLENGQ